MAQDVENIMWLAGFRGRLEGKPQPAAGESQLGWNDADPLMRLLKAHIAEGGAA